jgi:DNA-binding beta-propeller fold protein YncE
MQRKAWAAVLGAVVLAGLGTWALRRGGSWGAPRLEAVTPAVASLHVGQVLQLHGSGFRPGSTVKLGAPFERELPLATLSNRLATVRLPSGLELPKDVKEAQVTLSTGSGAGVTLRVVDASFYSDPQAFAVSPEGVLYLVSSTLDTLFRVLPDRSELAIPTGSRPAAVAVEATDAGHRAWVAHRGTPELQASDFMGKRVATVRGPSAATALLAAEGRLYVAEDATHTVAAYDTRNDGAELWRTPVAPMPGALAAAGTWLAVGSRATGEVELLDLSTGRPEPAIPTGGAPVRALASTPSGEHLLVATTGPLEQGIRGGVTVVDVAARRVLRHVPLGGGVTAGVAVNADGTVAATADLATGEVRTLDVLAITGAADPEPRAVVLSELSYPPSRGPCAPWAVDWSGKDGHVRVLDRASGTVVDYAPQEGKGRISQVRFDSVGVQAPPPEGMGLYMVEPTRSGLSCHGCHLDGNGLGMARTPGSTALVRNPVLRGRDEAALVAALKAHPGLQRSESELQRIAAWLAKLAPEPNPWLLADGTPPESLALPSGVQARPREGLQAFEALGCGSCHGPVQRPLAGLWQRWPLLHDGAAGRMPPDRDALRALLSRSHSEGMRMPGTEHRDALEAWLLVQ